MVSLAGLLLAVLVVLIAALVNLQALRSSMETLLMTNTAFFGDYIDSADGAFYDSVVDLTREFEKKNSLVLEFLGTDGDIVSSSFGLVSGSHPGTKDVDRALSNGELSVYRGADPATGKRILSVSAPVTLSDGKTAGVLRVVSSLKLVHRRILIWALGALGVYVLLLLTQLATAIWFLRNTVTPITEINEVSGRIAAGGYGVQIQKDFATADDEIGELTRTINNLSLQISQTEKLQTEFLSSCSHELRTPLTAIAGWTETLLGGNDLDDFTRRGMNTILSETQRLTSLVMELLEFTRIQDGRFKLNVEDCDLRTVFEDTIFMYGSRLSQQNITLNYDYNDEEIPEIRCDPERMKQVFLNILDNAAKYGSDGGRIDCSMHADEDTLTIEIRDYGQGIPEDELPLVKKKFYKGTAGTRGNGIGLAVCEEIVTVHGGTLTIANADDEEGGCLVTIELPYR